MDYYIWLCTNLGILLDTKLLKYYLLLLFACLDYVPASSCIANWFLQNSVFHFACCLLFLLLFVLLVCFTLFFLF